MSSPLVKPHLRITPLSDAFACPAGTMARPSESWKSFTNLAPESEHYIKIQRILSSADFAHLEARGLASRRRSQSNLPLDISCHVSLTKFTSGFNNVVLELAFSDNVYWIARIPFRAVDDNTKTSLLSEIATMKLVYKHTNIPVPRIFEFETSKDQPFGYPYILMEFLDGHVVENGLATSIPPQYHAKVAKQLANVFVQLQNQNLMFSRIGRLWCGENVDQSPEIIPMDWHRSPGPLETSLEYFYNQRQGENREVVALHPNDPDWLTACWVLKTAIAHIIIEDRVRGPFPLCHLDFHFGNMLFDNEYNLTGVIDWSSAQAAPLEQLSVCPDFVTFPGLSAEENRPIVELKNLVVHFVKEMEEHQEMSQRSDHQTVNRQQNATLTPLSSYLASKSAEITLRQYMASPGSSLFDGRMIAMLIYGENVAWEQLRDVYGTMPLQ